MPDQAAKRDRFLGLSGGRRVIVASTRRGLYSEGRGAAMDFQQAYPGALFRFLGIDAVQFVRAERLSRGADARNEAMNGAHAQIADATSRALAA